MNADAVTMAEPTKKLFYAVVSELENQDSSYRLFEVERDLFSPPTRGENCGRPPLRRADSWGGEYPETGASIDCCDPVNHKRHRGPRTEREKNPVAFKIILGSKIDTDHFTPKAQKRRPGGASDDQIEWFKKSRGSMSFDEAAQMMHSDRLSRAFQFSSTTGSLNDLQLGLLDTTTRNQKLDQYYRRKRVNWEFHRMVSYWSIMFYILGCSLFALACILGSSVVLTHVEMPESHTENMAQHRKYAFVAYPFMLGSLTFTIGGYIGWFRVLNDNYEGKSRFVWIWSRHLKFSNKKQRIKVIKAALYFIGGLFYLIQNVNKIIRGAKHSVGGLGSYGYETQVVDFLIIASGLQLVGCCLEIRFLQNWDKFDFLNANWWAVWVNLLTCTCFFIGSVSGAFVMDERQSEQWVNIPFLIGSIGLLVVSWWYLIIFKQEQWMFHYDTHKGKFQCSEQCFVVVYLYNLMLSLCCAVYAIDRRTKFDITTILFSTFGVIMHVMLLHLTNVISALPENKAWRCMLICLRGCVLLFSIPMTLLFLSWYDPVKFAFACEIPTGH